MKLEKVNAQEHCKEEQAEQFQSRIETDITDSEVDDMTKAIAVSIGSQYYAIYYICVETHTYVCFHENIDGILSEIGEKGNYDPAWDIYVKNYIMPEDQEDMRQFSDLSVVSERLKNHHSISRTYRRIGVGWTRGTFVAAKRDEKGNVVHVIYTVADINTEIELEEKQKRASYEAAHDALTGIYNRKGFERAVSSNQLKNAHIGFAILDVDNLKTLNDNFGHAIGDQVLRAVAEQLSDIFDEDDIIARIGGDEFVILLQNCDASAWKSICRKLRTIHANLANCLPKKLETSITLSAGLFFSDDGYSKQLFRFADAGLYETKRMGRAGCTLVNSKMQILEHWRDEAVSLGARSVLEFNNTGICQIEIPDDRQKPRRLICGELEKYLMGIPKTATPEECYVLWRDRINPSYREALFRTEKSMIEQGQTECTFLWQHPDHGTIFLRCGGFGEKKKGKTVLAGYCHPLKDTHIIEKQNDMAQVLQALNETFAASYYLNLEQDTASIFKLDSATSHILQDEKSITALNDTFLSIIVDPRDRELMQDFMDVNTMQERLKNERFLDAEYRSSLVDSWCRARLLPVRYDASGNLSHVLMTITVLDSGKYKEVYTLDYNRRSLSALFDHLPCGIVMYEWKNQGIEVVHVSKYYEEHYGHRLVKIDENNIYRQNDDNIHPDDRKDYRKALKVAMCETHELHHEYRVWDTKFNRYIWERVDAIISPQQKDTQMIYAVYTDITQQKEQDILLEKNHASLLAALNASDQLCYEYDPMLHIRECLTDENFFNLPKEIENYPDSLKEMDLIYPEDMDEYIKTVHQMDDGLDSAQCDIRIKRNGIYGWYSCDFHRYYDPEKKRHIAILTIMDISLRKAMQKMYEDRLRSMATITETTLCMSLINLTKNTYEVVECLESVRPYVNTTLPLKDYLLFAASAIIGEEDQEKFRETFRIDHLLQQVEEGNTHQEIEYLLKINDDHYEWIYSAVDLIQNPLTGEVMGAVYSKSMQTEKINQILLRKTLEQDYLFVATIFVDTDEFYLYNYQTENYSQCMKNYWDIALINMKGHCSEEVQKELKQIFVKQNILNHLENHSEYSYSYNGILFGKSQRLEIRFSYGDASHTMLLASMRNITDTVILEQYRHDSEHDSLTDLYNRKTMFRKCRELLETHPDDTYAMIHIDMKHFRLYNTFFGDAAGDQLLCDVADMFRWMDADYDYWVYGRIEADVFAIFLPYNQELYRKHTSKVMQILREYRSDFLIEPTIGIYFITDRDMPIEAMFTRATLASKMVRPDTPYATVIFDEEMEKTLKGDQEILSEMQTAIDKKQFHVYLQPKYSLLTDQPVGAEALVRWIHPKWGFVLPNRFIPLFESNGFIATLDRYVWESVCQLLSKWKNEGKTLMPISVNVSRISAYSLDTVSFLKKLVQKYDLEPKYLELELTESAYVESPEEIHARLSELQEYGFKILMDDFGSGYSSLNTLKDLTIDILKLDMKFLSSAESERGSKILSSMVSMSKLLDLPVISEGVETEKQAEYLRSIGCEYVQGYLFARPMPVEDYEDSVLNALH